eukprot:1160535-Pelagomonas_calceolata.AAC.14
MLCLHRHPRFLIHSFFFELVHISALAFAAVPCAIAHHHATVATVPFTAVHHHATHSLTCCHLFVVHCAFLEASSRPSSSGALPHSRSTSALQHTLGSAQLAARTAVTASGGSGAGAGAPHRAGAPGAGGSSSTAAAAAAPARTSPKEYMDQLKRELPTEMYRTVRQECAAADRGAPGPSERTFDCAPAPGLYSIAVPGLRLSALYG